MKNLTIIDHPPGMRKNPALHDIYKQRIADGKTVLVLSSTHRDTTAARVVIIGGHADVVLIDNEAMALENVQALASEFPDVEFVASMMPF
ncbi:hypothetical protein [Bradyrhizobium sp.]|uniref:hypothetical protein n=1 Tax=Bradyrhizobium sp. TaxID=376 RepID=UPI0039E6F4F2